MGLEPFDPITTPGRIAIREYGNAMLYETLAQAAVHAPTRRAVLQRIVEEMKDEAKIEQPPSMEGRSLYMIIAPQ